MNQQEDKARNGANEENEVSCVDKLSATSTKEKLERMMNEFSSFDETMRIGTRQRREKDEHRVADMKQEVFRLQKKLDAEIKKRIELNKSLTELMDNQVASMLTSFEHLLETRAQQVDARLDALNKQIADISVQIETEKREIPLLIERKTNELTQKLVRFMNAFEEERQRRLGQEESILKRLSEFEHETMEHFDAERRDRELKYSELKSTMDDFIRNRTKGDETFYAITQDQVAKIQNSLVEEAQTREREDDEIIEALNRYTAKLQESLRTINSPDA